MLQQMRKSVLILCLLTACLLPARAQFYLSGDDPARLRWNSIETAHYQIIYPDGADSLARMYGRSLEQYRIPLGRSLGDMTPGAGRRRKMPVVLHTHYNYSNGSVGWAPSRYDLYTKAETYGSDPIPWHLQLASHEPRHQAQLQFGQRGFLSWISGELWAPIYWQVYIEQAYGEGDAVVGETGLASGTRARTADFLNFYRVALDQGDYRSWEKWRYGSFKHYTPDHYALGYVTLAGARSLYDSPLLLRESLDLAWKKPWYIGPYNTQKVIKQHSGKSFKQAFRDILDGFNSQWQADYDARAPFMELEPVTRDEAYDMEYSTPQWVGNGLLALRRSYLRPTELVLIREGRVERIRSFASHTSSLFYNDRWNRVYWTETLNHPRWDLDGSSDVFYYDLNTNRIHRITRGGRYYNPQPSDDGERLAVMELPVEGGSNLVILNARDGQVLRRTPLPEDIQGKEQAWMGEDIYVSGVTVDGFGIYRLASDGEWTCLMEPSVQKVVNMGSGEDYVEWVSDRTGVNELYRYYPADGRLLQMTNTPYGATDFTEGDGYLYSVGQTLEGRQVFRTPLVGLKPTEVSYADVHSYFFADRMTEQELSLGEAPDLNEDVPISAPKRYSKLAHPLRLHSWLPLYVNYDAVLSSSMDFSYETAAIGLSGFFQNTLGTFSGMLGYALHPDPDREHAWRSALHLKMTYTGLYPVIEASMDIGDHASRQYVARQMQDGDVSSYQVSAIPQATPQISATVRTYLPLSFGRGGRYYGFTPQLKYTFSNSIFSTTPLKMTVPGRFQGLPAYFRLASPEMDLNGPISQHLSASLRGYVMAPRAKSQTYPRWGIGLEGGIGFRPGLKDFYAPNVYGYAYGYLPGITRAQGLKWTATFQQKLDACAIGDLYAGTIPRGFDSSASSFVGQIFPWQCRITGDYAIPIYVGDISIPGIAYIRNFLLSPHADYTWLPSDYNLWSVGADLSASLARLLVLPFSASVGVSFSYLGGSLLPYLDQEKPYSVSLIFGVDF